ncbi:hypothetical protein D3C87_2158970 [compost metagenome]
MQLDLLADPGAPAEPLELGLRTGRNELIAYLQRLQAMGVAHVLFNLAQVSGRAPAEVLREIGEQVLPRL